MNTLEILYQAFRVRYSLNQLQQILDRGCRVAVLAPEGGAEVIRGFLGEPIPGFDERQPLDDLVILPWELDEAASKELRTCDACVVYFPEGPPDEETLEELAGKIPLHVKTLWVCEAEGPQAKVFHEKDLTLPTVRSLPTASPGPHFLRLLLASLPQVSLVLARDWTLLREYFCQTLTRRTALRNGVRAGISSLPLRTVPVVGPVLAMLATSAETMMLTSSQLRLSFVIAAVHGRPLDFFDRISELWPIVGSAFGFRGVSRYLVKLLPGGFRPGTKASIAFAGTFAVGEASRLFYHMGQPDSDEVRRELLRRSHEEGAREAQLLFRRILAGQSIDEVGVGGTEVIDLVEGLTTLESVVGDPILGEALNNEEERLREAVAQQLQPPSAENVELEESAAEQGSAQPEDVVSLGDPTPAEDPGPAEDAIPSPQPRGGDSAAGHGEEPDSEPQPASSSAPDSDPGEASDSAPETAPIEEPATAAEPDPIEEPATVAEPAPIEEPATVGEPRPIEEPRTVEAPLPATAEGKSKSKRSSRPASKKDGSGRSRGKAKGKKPADEE